MKLTAEILEKNFEWVPEDGSWAIPVVSTKGSKIGSFYISICDDMSYSFQETKEDREGECLIPPRRLESVEELKTLYFLFTGEDLEVKI
jgi:hypothetical protein